MSIGAIISMTIIVGTIIGGFSFFLWLAMKKESAGKE